MICTIHTSELRVFSFCLGLLTDFWLDSCAILALAARKCSLKPTKKEIAGAKMRGGR